MGVLRGRFKRALRDGGAALEKASGLTLAAALLLAAGCTADIGIDDFKYACQKESDCGEGYACQSSWCVKLREKGDGGKTDTGVQKDAGHDAGADGGDAGGDGGPDAGDAGPGGDGGLLLMYSSTYDSAAGVGASKDFTLKVVTGWSAGPKWSVGGYKLKMGHPFEAGRK